MTKETKAESANGKLDDTQLDAAVGGTTDSSIIPCIKTVSGIVPIIPCIKTTRTIVPCVKTP